MECRTLTSHPACNNTILCYPHCSDGLELLKVKIVHVKVHTEDATDFYGELGEHKNILAVSAYVGFPAAVIC